MNIQLLTGEAALRQVPGLIPLACAIFDDGDDFASLPQDAAEKPGLMLLLVWDDGERLGFKMGYRRSDTTFYSWLGGVHPDARGQGVARRLMDEQHAWIHDQGYSYVTTETYNRYREMLLLNIHVGFDVVGTQTDTKGQTKILLRKTMPEDHD